MGQNEERALAELQSVALGLGNSPADVGAVLADLGSKWAFPADAADGIREHLLAGRKLDAAVALVRAGIDAADVSGVNVNIPQAPKLGDHLGDSDRNRRRLGLPVHQDAVIQGEVRTRKPNGYNGKQARRKNRIAKASRKRNRR